MCWKSWTLSQHSEPSSSVTVSRGCLHCLTAGFGNNILSICMMAALPRLEHCWRAVLSTRVWEMSVTLPWLCWQTTSPTPATSCASEPSQGKLSWGFAHLLVLAVLHKAKGILHFFFSPFFFLLLFLCCSIRFWVDLLAVDREISQTLFPASVVSYTVIQPVQ